MRKIILFVVAIFAAVSVIASDQFYVIMGDGSVESDQTDDFDNSETAKIMGFNDMAREIADLKREIYRLKTGNYFMPSVSGTVDGHDYVDLGLPSGLKWATMNVGAKEVSDYGSRFAWGEVTPTSYEKNDCGEKDTDYKFLGKVPGELRSMGVVDGNANLTPDYDAATQNWGENWRMPTLADFSELIDNCTCTMAQLDGVNGFKFESKQEGNNNCIFLPSEDFVCKCWSSSISIKDKNICGESEAYGLKMKPSSVLIDAITLYYGRAVRPVKK